MRDASYLPSPKNTLSFIGAWKWKIGNASLGIRGTARTRGLHFFLFPVGKFVRDGAAKTGSLSYNSSRCCAMRNTQRLKELKSLHKIPYSKSDT